MTAKQYSNLELSRFRDVQALVDRGREDRYVVVLGLERRDPLRC